MKVTPAGEVTVRYTFGAAEFRRLLRGVILLSPPVQGALAAIWLVLVISFFVVLTRKSSVAAALLDTAVTLLLVAGAVLLVVPFIRWRVDRSLGDERTVTLSAQGLTSTTSRSTSFLPWDGIRGEALEDARLLCFVRAGGRAGVLIPKRAIASPDELRAVRELAAARVRTYIGFASGWPGLGSVRTPIDPTR